MTLVVDEPRRLDVGMGDTVRWRGPDGLRESRVVATDDEGIATMQGRVPWNAPGLELAARADSTPARAGENPELPAALSADERAELAACEGEIEAGLASFVATGQALLKIRAGRLYRGSHGSFEEYLRERWQISRPRGYELMGAAEVIGNLSAIADTRPANEAQARPLTRLDPGQQRAAWEIVEGEAAEGREITAAVVERAAEQVAPRPERPAPPVSRPEPVAAAAAPVARDPAPAAELVTLETRPAPAPEPPRQVAAPAPPAAPAKPAAAPPAPAAPARPAAAPTPAPAAPVAPAAPEMPTPGFGAFVTCLVPEADYDWLLDHALSVAVAVGQSRRLYNLAARRGIDAGALLSTLEDETP